MIPPNDTKRNTNSDFSFSLVFLSLDSSQAYGQYAQTGTGGYEYGYQYPYAYYNAPGGHYGQYQAAYSQTAYHAPYASSSGVSHAPIDPSIDPLAYPGEKKGAENGQDSAEAKEAEKAKKTTRYAAGRVWEDTSMADWPENDFRIYVGNLGEEVDDKTLHDAFSSFPSLARWRVVRDKKYDLTKGFGFVSFLDPREGVKALKTMNGRYIGSRPCKLTKSTHDKRAYHKKK